jgi:hypothetical protein
MILSAFYPLHTKGTKVRVQGKSKYKGQTGEITADPTGNTQAYFNVILDSGKRLNLHAESLIIMS